MSELVGAERVQELLLANEALLAEWEGLFCESRERAPGETPLSLRSVHVNLKRQLKANLTELSGALTAAVK